MLFDSTSTVLFQNVLFVKYFIKPVHELAFTFEFNTIVLKKKYVQTHQK